MRLVLDTSVLTASIRSYSGASRELVAMGLQYKFDWLISEAITLEYEDVLTRPEHLLAARLTELQVHRLLDIIFSVGERTVVTRTPAIHLPDIGDEHVLALALSGEADAVVTHNQRHFASLPSRFGVNLYSPAEALHLLRRSHG